jgi:hypothetical protein
MNPFQFSEYREILRETLLAKKAQHGRRYTFANLAKACRLQHTYLSTVLKGNGHLNADQVYDAAQYLGLADDEYRFLSLVHEYERSTSAGRRRRLAQEIETARQQGLRTDPYVEAKPLPELEAPAVVDFYLDPNAALVHMFMTVQRFRGEPERARRALGLDPAVFAEALRKAERVGLLRRQGARVALLQDTIHLPAASPLYQLYRTSLRQKALEFMQTRSANRHYSFGVLYSASEATRAKIHARFLEFVDWAQQLTQGEPPTDVYQLNFELLRWSED